MQSWEWIACGLVIAQIIQFVKRYYLTAVAAVLLFTAFLFAGLIVASHFGYNIFPALHQEAPPQI
jgi:hypothetical protein